MNIEVTCACGKHGKREIEAILDMASLSMRDDAEIADELDLPIKDVRKALAPRRRRSSRNKKHAEIEDDEP